MRRRSITFPVGGDASYGNRTGILSFQKVIPAEEHRGAGRPVPVCVHGDKFTGSAFFQEITCGYQQEQDENCSRHDRTFHLFEQTRHHMQNYNRFGEFSMNVYVDFQQMFPDRGCSNFTCIYENRVKSYRAND